MLGGQQAKIIGILRVEYEKNPEKFLTIKEIHNILIDKTDSSPAYNTVATILKRLAEQNKINSYAESNRYMYQYKDIQNQVTDNMLSMFISAFGASGITNLIEKGKKLTTQDIEDLKKLLENEP